MEDQEKVISESEIVFAEEVMKSWGEDSRSFGDLLCNNNFKILFCRKPPRVTPSGERILICSEGTANNIYADDEGYYDLKGIWLFKPDVEEHLKSHPYLSFPIDADAIVDSGGSGSTYDIFDDLISFYAVKSKIQIGPSQFVDAVKDHNTPVYYKTTNGFEGTSLGQYDNLRLCVGDLNNAWFHENDVKHLYLQTKDNFQEKKLILVWHLRNKQMMRSPT